MAYCKIKSVKNNLKRVIDYVANSEKTDEDIYLELHKELNLPLFPPFFPVE